MKSNALFCALHLDLPPSINASYRRSCNPKHPIIMTPVFAAFKEKSLLERSKAYIDWEVVSAIRKSMQGKQWLPIREEVEVTFETLYKRDLSNVLKAVEDMTFAILNADMAVTEKKLNDSLVFELNMKKFAEKGKAGVEVRLFLL